MPVATWNFRRMRLESSSQEHHIPKRAHMGPRPLIRRDTWFSSEDSSERRNSSNKYFEALMRPSHNLIPLVNTLNGSFLNPCAFPCCLSLKMWMKACTWCSSIRGKWHASKNISTLNMESPNQRKSKVLTAHQMSTILFKGALRPSKVTQGKHLFAFLFPFNCRSRMICYKNNYLPMPTGGYRTIFNIII